MLKVGDSLPEFTVVNQNAQPVTQNDFLKYYSVLYFYPRDNTPGCTIEACDFSSELSFFKNLEVPVYGVSADSVASHKKFIDSKKLTIDLLSDENHSLCESCGVWVEKKMYGRTFMGIVRTTFIIDPMAKVVHRFDKVKVKEHIVEVKQKLKDLINS